MCGHLRCVYSDNLYFIHFYDALVGTGKVSHLTLMSFMSSNVWEFVYYKFCASFPLIYISHAYISCCNSLPFLQEIISVSCEFVMSNTNPITTMNELNRQLSNIIRAITVRALDDEFYWCQSDPDGTKNSLNYHFVCGTLICWFIRVIDVCFILAVFAIQMKHTQLECNWILSTWNSIFIDGCFFSASFFWLKTLLEVSFFFFILAWIKSNGASVNTPSGLWLEQFEHIFSLATIDDKHTQCESHLLFDDDSLNKYSTQHRRRIDILNGN